MNMHWWDAVTAVAAAVVPVASVLWLLVRLTIRGIIRDENDKQIVKINGTYVRSMGTNMSGMEIQRHMEEIRSDHKRLYDYAHEGLHNMNNEISGLKVMATLKDIRQQ